MAASKPLSTMQIRPSFAVRLLAKSDAFAAPRLRSQSNAADMSLFSASSAFLQSPIGAPV